MAEPSTSGKGGNRNGVPHAGQLVRVVGRDGPAIKLTLDGDEISAIEGDSVLTALLTARPFLRRLEFGDEPRAGFCLMGACQDCWVWTESGGRLRACTTPAAAGMALLTAAPALR